MESSKASAILTQKIIQSYCLTMGVIEDYCKQTAANTGEHPDSIKRRIKHQGEKYKVKLLEELAGLQK